MGRKQGFGAGLLAGEGALVELGAAGRVGIDPTDEGGGGGIDYRLAGEGRCGAERREQKTGKKNTTHIVSPMVIGDQHQYNPKIIRLSKKLFRSFVFNHLQTAIHESLNRYEKWRFIS